MKDFTQIALPFIIMGVSILVVFINAKKNKKNYLTEGMCLGMSFGLMFNNLLDGNQTSLCLGLGMLVGEAIGSCIKRKSK